MSIETGQPPILGLRHGVDALRGNWYWLVILGIALVVMGTVALSSVVVASLATAVVIGSVLLVSGFAEAIAAIWSREWSGFFLHLLSGILSIVVGGLFLRSPVGALLSLTLLLSAALMVSGLFKIVAALSYRFATWAWTLAGGVLDLILAGLILQEWPSSAFWVIGMFVGISLIFRGFNWIGLGLALKSLPRIGAL